MFKRTPLLVAAAVAAVAAMSAACTSPTATDSPPPVEIRMNEDAVDPGPGEDGKIYCTPPKYKSWMCWACGFEPCITH